MPHPTLRSPLLRSLRATALMTVAAAALSVSPALAAVDIEPNDAIPLASTGPFEIASGESNGGSLASGDDVDVYQLDLSSLPAADKEIAIDVVNGTPLGVVRCLDARVYTSDGTPIGAGDVQPVPCDAASSGDVQFVRPTDDLVYLQVSTQASPGAGDYAFSVYSGRKANDNYGFVATLSGTDADDTQRVYVNSPGLRQSQALIAESQGTQTRKVSLGIHFPMPSDPNAGSLFTFVSQSTDAGWSWDWTLTNRSLDASPFGPPQTIFHERASGRSLTPIKPGITRMVTVDPTGRIMSAQCADGVIAVPCGNVPKVDYPTYPVVTPTPTPAPAAPVAAAAGPAPAPKPVAKPTLVAIKLVGAFKVSGKGKTIKGKLSATKPACLVGAKVSLVQKAAKPKKGKKAKKDKTLGSTTAKADGRWTIKLKKAAKGKTYVKVVPAAKNAALCAAGQSKTKTL